MKIKGCEENKMKPSELQKKNLNKMYSKKKRPNK